jgi:hypothetical protein
MRKLLSLGLMAFMLASIGLTGGTAKADPIDCPLLLIDDDSQDPDVQGAYVFALDTLGIAYDVRDLSGGGPPLEFNELVQYDVVLYFTGDRTSDFGMSAALASDYVLSGGGLLISSENWLTSPGVEGFVQGILGVATVYPDEAGTVLTGVAGDPIGDLFGTVNLTYPPSFEQAADGVDVDTAQPSYLNESSHAAVFHSAVQEGGKVVFFSASWAAIAEASQDTANALLQASLNMICNPVPRIFIAGLDRSADGCKGSDLLVKLSLINLTYRTETFDMTYDSAWGGEGPATIGPLAHGEEFGFEVQVTIPEEANPGSLEVLHVTATTQGTPIVERAGDVEMHSAYMAAVEEPLPNYGRYDAGAGWYNGKLAIVGGSQDPSTVELRTEIFNGVEFIEGASMPSPGLADASGCATIGPLLYIAGNASEHNLYIYNIAEDSWTVEGIPGTIVPTQGYELVAYNGSLYRIGGESPGGGGPSLPTLFRYTPGEGWEPLASMNTGRSNFGAWVMNDKLYVAGGVVAPGVFTETTEVYDFETDTWLDDPGNFAYLPGPIARFAAPIFVDSPMIVAGVRQDGSPNSEALVYFSDNNTWAPLFLEPPLSDRSTGVTTGWDFEIFVVGGHAVGEEPPQGKESIWAAVPCNPPELPTPEPSPTSPPTYTPLPTSTPTNTPVPTDTPTATPTPTNTTGPGTPTYTPIPPTDTPVPPTDTPIPPTDTPTSECTTFGVIDMDYPSYVSPGETFWLYASCCNPGDPRQNAPFVAMLDIGIDEYWFYPSWAHYPPDFDFKPLFLDTGIWIEEIFPEFTWPDTGQSSFDGINIYAAFLTPDMTDIDGEIAVATFGYGP